MTIGRVLDQGCPNFFEGGQNESLQKCPRAIEQTKATGEKLVSKNVD